MSNPCDTYALKQVDDLVGTFDSTPDKPGYPTQDDYERARNFAIKRICLERGFEWNDDTKSCHYTQDQCTVKTTGTCYQGLQDPLGAGTLTGCNKISVGFENMGHSPCCLKRPPLFPKKESSPTYVGLDKPLPPNSFQNMSFATFDNTEHNVFPYTKDKVGTLEINVPEKTCAYLQGVGQWDKLTLTCKVNPTYAQSSIHTCTIPDIGEPDGQGGKSLETMTPAELKAAQAACTKVEGTFSATNGCVVRYAIDDLEKNPDLIDQHIEDCHSKKGFYNIRNIDYKEYQNNQCINGMIYAPVRKMCEMPSSRVDSKGDPTTGLYEVPPFRYNTKYSGQAFDFEAKKADDLWVKNTDGTRKDWLCAATKSYCDKFEMSYNSDATGSKNPGCYESTGENIAEMVFGKTMIRNFKRDVIENTEDAYNNCGGGVAGVACGAGAAVAGTGEFIGDTVKDVGESVGKVGEDIGNFLGHIFTNSGGG